jgi:outer membrane protein OmpA-like peptidoglycan-associated protein
VAERVKQKVAERKWQTEESLATRAAEPADSAMARIAQPVESLAARVGGAAGSAIGGAGRGNDGIEEESARIGEALGAGRADLPDLRFEPGTATLAPEAEPHLAALAAALAASPGAYLVQGRADAGTAEPGAAAVALARARAIKSLLVTTGVSAEQLYTAGDGLAAPDGALVTLLPMQ